MAEDILSQEEVDALLRGVSGESEVQVQASDVPGGIRAYDIGRQERIVRGRMPTLELINERFARGLRVGLFNLARKNAEVAVGPVRVLKYGDFVRNLVVPTNLNLVLAKPLRGTALVVLEPGLVFRVVDNLFGGQGRFHTRIEGRDFTPTEQRIIQRLLRVVLDEYEKAWAPVFALQLEYVRSEMNTQFANIATPSEVVVASSFSVDLGTGADDIHICMPYAMLEPVRDIIYSSVQADRSVADDRWLKFISQQVREAPVELVATLGRTMVTVRDLLILQPGDVLAMDLPESVTAEVEGVPLLKGRYGVVNGRYALKVEQVLNGEQDGGE
jgi:flagellar motor switch protein FliM